MAMFVSMVALAILSQISQPNAPKSGPTMNSTVPDILQRSESELTEENLTISEPTSEGPSMAVSVITVISLSAFLLFHSVGFNVIPFILMGELCPVKLKSLTSGIIMAFVSVVVFGIIKVFPFALEEIGGAGTYGFFALFCIGGVMFALFLIPETRGKSADELSHFYRQRVLAINPVDIMSTTMSLPGSRKTSELGSQPMGITGISLAWAGTGQAQGKSFSRKTSTSNPDGTPEKIDLTDVHINKLQAPPRYDNTRKSSNAHSNKGYID